MAKFGGTNTSIGNTRYLAKMQLPTASRDFSTLREVKSLPNKVPTVSRDFSALRAVQSLSSTQGSTKKCYKIKNHFIICPTRRI